MWGVFGIIGLVVAILIIVDVWTKQTKMDQTQKIVWTVCAVFFSIITGIIYYFVVKRK